MLATISPANIHVEETLSTLRYAKQARNIINQARVNEDPNAAVIHGKNNMLDILEFMLELTYCHINKCLKIDGN